MAKDPNVQLDELVASTKAAFDAVDESKRRPDELQEQAMACIWDLSRKDQANLGKAAAIQNWPMAPLSWKNFPSGSASANRRSLTAVTVHYIFNDSSWCSKHPGLLESDGTYRHRMQATT